MKFDYNQPSCFRGEVVIGLLVLEKKIFKGFYHIWAWRPCWSCDPGHLNNFSLLKGLEAVYEIWLKSAK